MSIEKLKELLNHKSEAGVSIVTVNGASPHLSNTWSSYITLVGEDTLIIPAGGMQTTESNIKENDAVILSITNANVDGFSGLGTGVIVNGKGTFISVGQAFDRMKDKFPWIRAVLEVKVSDIKQTY